MSAERVQIEQVHINRGGRRVVSDVSFSLAPGKITVLLGANGAGKSSLVLAIAGAIPIESGTIRQGDRLLSGLDAAAIRQCGIALVPEGHRVLGDMTAEENLLVVAGRLIRPARRRSLEQVYAILPELVERRHQRAGSLSGGQKQMVAFGQAMMTQPDHVIIDELSLGLAPAVVKRLVDVLKSLRDRGIGILLIEQFAKLALGIADHALVLERGRIVFDGSAPELEGHPEILHAAYLATPER